MSCADYSRHKKNRCGEGTRYFDKRERSGQPERCGIEKPPVSQEVSSSNNKREPIVPIGPAGMVRRRVTSSVERRGTVVPLLCSIFLPARICRKATELDVVKEGLLRLRRGRTWVRIPPSPCKLSSELL